MTALAMTVLLAVVGVAAFPCWSHSARWGHGPSAAAGVLLLVVAVVTASGRPTLVLDGMGGRAIAPIRADVADAGIVRVATVLRLEETGPP